jgi:hypothetical protein
MDPDPIANFIMQLLAAASMVDDRMKFTGGASSQADRLTAVDLIGVELVRRGRKWDKENRSSWRLCPGQLELSPQRTHGTKPMPYTANQPIPGMRLLHPCSYGSCPCGRLPANRPVRATLSCHEDTHRRWWHKARN